MKSLDEFVKALSDNPIIKRFQELEKILNNDSNLQQLVHDMKSIQKEFVHAKTFQQKENELFLNEKLDNIQNQINEYPLYLEYLELQEEINEMLQRFVDIFEDGLDKEINDIQNK